MTHFNIKILSALILLLRGNIYAQDTLTEKQNAERHICIGIRYGLGINSLNSNNTGKILVNSSVSKLNFGLVFEGDITKNFSIQPEMQYIQKGFSMTNVGTNTIEAKLNYIGFNLLPKIKFKSEDIEFFIFTGPSFNINASAESTDGVRSTSIPNVSSTDFGVIIGTGLASKSSLGKFFIDVRYCIGVLDISNESPKASVDRLNQLGISIGYMFNLN